MRKPRRLLRLYHALRDKFAPQIPAPLTIADLASLFPLLSPNCPCPTCKPPRKPLLHPPWPHHKIPLLSFHPLNLHDITTFTPPLLSSSFRLPAPPHNLIPTILTILTLPPANLSSIQLSALSALSTLHSWRDSSLPLLTKPIPTPDARTLLPAPLMHHLAQSLSTLLFTTPLPHLTFTWNASAPNLLDQTTTSPTGRTRIRMNPLRTSRDFGDYAVLDFLSTLVHEVVHGFLQRYACRWCVRGGGEGAHGWVFQRVARGVEEVLPWWVGWPVRLGRWESYLGDLGVGEGRERLGRRGRRRVVCGREVERWGVEDVRVRVENDEVKKEIERVYRERWR